MTKFRDVALPEDVMESFRGMVLTANDDEIMTHAQYVDQSLIQGLRPVKANIPKVRERFAKRVCVPKTLPQETIGFLSRVNPLRIFNDLSEEAIRGHIDQLCSVLGRGEVLASLLLSTEPHQKMAIEVIEEDLLLKDLSIGEARNFASSIKLSYAPFLNLLHGFANGGEPEFEILAEGPLEKRGAVPTQQAKVQGEKIRNLEGQLKELRTDIKKYKKQAAQLEGLTRKLVRSERKRDELKQNVIDLKNCLGESKSQYISQQAAIAAKVDEKVHSALHSWIAAPLNVEYELTKGNNDLAETARALIARQQQVDRHSGNRKTLRHRLEELTALRVQLQELSVESINPLAELAYATQQLDREIDRIQKVLGSTRQGSAFGVSFRQRIGLAESPDELYKLKMLLGQLTQNEVVTHSEARSLFEYCDHRMSLAYDKHTPGASQGPVQIDPFYQFKGSLIRNDELTWLLDGHNILFSLPDLFGTFAADGKPTERARYALEETLVKLVKDSVNVQVCLFFDSSERSTYSPADNVKVVYSGGTGDNRADREICTHLEYCRHNAPGTPTLVTSDDRDLRSQSEQLGADLMWMDEFFSLARSVM